MMLSTSAQAAFIINVNQDGSNVVATGSGSLDLTDLATNSGATNPPTISPDNTDIPIGQYSEEFFYHTIST